MIPETSLRDREGRADYSPAFIVFWIALFGALALLVARRLGAFYLWETVTTLDGKSIRFPNGFAIVDHPFHAVRGETLRRALAEGDLLRWIGHHQGGYPSEFYPLGVAWLDVIAWGIAFGSLPMMAIHKVVGIGIFLAPLIGFILIAGFDRRSMGVALLAGVGHLSIRGWWWSGGTMELIEWGMVTNVAAATSLVIALPLAARFIERGTRQWGGIGIALAAFSLVTNPRAGIALVALLAGIAISVFLSSDLTMESALLIARRIAFFGLVTGLLAAPEIISLVRYSDLYYFVQYSGYATLKDYLDSSVQAVGGPFFVLGLAGFIVAWLPGSDVVSRSIAATLGLYVALTAALVSGIGPGSLIGQLETTRLMPFQRFLWFVMAAIAVEWVLIRLGRASRAFSPFAAVDIGLLVISGAVVVLYVVAPPSFIPESDRGLVLMQTTADAGLVDLRDAVTFADGEADPGTAMLVLGTVVSWHDGLWAPLWTDRPLFYDDWLWYWQQKHFGAYNPATEHAYPTDASALEPEYLEHHGIGAIVVTGSAKPVARSASNLTLVREGTWDVYRVNEPISVITFDGVAPESQNIGDHEFVATGVVTSGEIRMRRNWFPRWSATVNGVEVPITQTADGYMSITSPQEGEVTVRLTYSSTLLDWLSRAMALVGLLALIGMLLPRSNSLRGGSRSARAVPRVIPRVQSEHR